MGVAPRLHDRGPEADASWRLVGPPELRDLPATRIEVPAGTVLIAAGSTAPDVYVVLEGRVSLAVRLPGAGRRTVAVVTSGGVVGDIPAVLRRDMPFDVLADTDVVLRRHDRQAVIEVLSRSPALALRWAASLAARLERVQSRLVTLLTKDLSAQVATVLLEEATREQGVLVVRMPHQTIANLLGARRQSVSRVLGRMRRQGLVASRYGAVEVVDPAGVAAVAGHMLRPPTPTTPAAS